MRNDDGDDDVLDQHARGGFYGAMSLNNSEDVKCWAIRHIILIVI